MDLSGNDEVALGGRRAIKWRRRGLTGLEIVDVKAEVEVLLDDDELFGVDSQYVGP